MLMVFDGIKMGSRILLDGKELGTTTDQFPNPAPTATPNPNTNPKSNLNPNPNLKGARDDHRPVSALQLPRLDGPGIAAHPGGPRPGP